jgi:hypothetical protein
MADTHLQVEGQVTRLGQTYDALVDIDTGARICCISEQWARNKDLKSYTQRYPKLVTGICHFRSPAKAGAILIDSVGVVREHS